MPRALIIEKEPLELIFRGEKSLEIRTRKVKFREVIGLIEKGTKTVVGIAFLRDVFSFSPKKPSSTICFYSRMTRRELMLYGKGRKLLYAYVLKGVKRFKKPASYRHPSGAVTWVKIPKLENKMSR